VSHPVHQQGRSGSGRAFSAGFTPKAAARSRLEVVERDSGERHKPLDQVKKPTKRLDVPRLRTLFGAKARPHRDRTSSSRIEAVVQTPATG